jgi:hypothetical protein
MKIFLTTLFVSSGQNPEPGLIYFLPLEEDKLTIHLLTNATEAQSGNRMPGSFFNLLFH